MKFINALFISILFLVKPSANANQQEINVGMHPWPGYFSIVLADKLGFFDKHGLKVNYQIYEDEVKLLEHFESDKLDIIFVSVGDAIPIASNNKPLKIIFVTDLSAGADALLSPTRLASKVDHLKIGVKFDSFGELFVERFLDDYKTAYNRYQLINLLPENVEQAFIDQTVDIAHSWGPYLDNAMDNGYKIIYTSRQTPGLIFDVATVRDDFNVHHKKAVTAFTKAWFSTSQWWLKNPDKGNRIIQLALNLEEPPNLKGIRIMDAKGNHDAFFNKNSPRYTPKIMQRYLDFYRSRSKINGDITINDLLDSTYIKAITR